MDSNLCHFKEDCFGVHLLENHTYHLILGFFVFSKFAGQCKQAF